MRRTESQAAASVERFLQFSLLGMVAAGFMALVGSGRLDTPAVLVVAAGLAVRALIIGGVFNLRLPPRALAVATALYAVFFLGDLFWISHDLAASATHLLFFLALIKILTAQESRDSLPIAAIAALALITGALVSIDLNFFLALGLFVAFAIAALAANEIRRSMERAASTPRGGLKRFYPRLALLAGSLALGILALTAALFFVIPRTADAALARMSRSVTLPGFSDQVTLGEIGDIKQSSRVAMHVRLFSSQLLGPIRWRGGALSDFDGRRWSEPPGPARRIPVVEGQASLALSPLGFSRHISYQVEYDALDSPALFFAGSPERVELAYPFVTRGSSGSYRVDNARQPVRYEAYSRLEEAPEMTAPRVPAPVLPLPERERNLELPEPLDPRIPALARETAASAETDLERARAIEMRLRRDYAYSLDRRDRRVPDPLVNFLFDNRKGHCEYFASAMAVLLRSVGIPARVATGFLGGEYNPITDLWVVRASDAHSWVEAWIGDYGWTTFDPTPPDPNGARPAAIAKLGLYLDAGRTLWRDWVLDYDSGRQGALAGRFERSAQGLGIRWYELLSAINSAWVFVETSARKPAAMMAAAGLALLASAWLWLPPLIRAVRHRRRVERVRSGRAEGSDATLMYRRMLQCLKRRGYQKPAWFTPVEFARALPPGSLGSAVADFTEAYNAVRFGGHTAVAARLSGLLEGLESAHSDRWTRAG